MSKYSPWTIWWSELVDLRLHHKKCRLRAAIFYGGAEGNRKDGASAHTGAIKCPVDT